MELALKFTLVMGLALFLVMTALGLFSFIRSFFEKDSADIVILTKGNPFLRATVKALSWIVGKDWCDFGVSIRLVAFYWIAITTLGSLVFVADPSWTVHDSTLITASWHVLIWSNIFTDYVSLNVTRNCIREFMKPDNTGIWRNLKLIMKDLGVATSMLILAWIGGNLAFLLLTSVNWEAVAHDFFFTVFDPNTLTNTFAVRSGPQGVDPTTGLPWMVI